MSHAKTLSEATSLDASTPPRSPRRPLYYVQSPSNQDVEKMSYGSSPLGSPHHYYHSSPIHHSRESSNSRFSASMKSTKNVAGWRKVQRDQISEDDEEENDGGDSRRNIRLYVCFVFLFVALFTVFSLILWGIGKSYEPKIVIEHIVFNRMNVQAGNDRTGVPTDMLSMNSTVKIQYKNTGTFFGVHVTATPLELYYFQLRVASGQMKKFYRARTEEHPVVTPVWGYQVPLYGGVSALGSPTTDIKNVVLPLNLTFVMRSRAYILGKLVKCKFVRRIRCSVTISGKKLGHPLHLNNSCTYK